MFEDRTVFIIGAGASAEFNLPVGYELLSKIRDNSFFEFGMGMRNPQKGVGKIYEAVSERYASDGEMREKLFNAFRDVHNGVDTAGSIDEFINRYADDPLIAEIGKLQIAYAICEAEAGSSLNPKRGNEREGINWENAEKTWIAPFARALFDGVRASEVESIGNNITIICFNYDRCIEHYLEYAIQRAYRGVDRKTARQIVRNIKIIHPYGWLGDLGQRSFGTPMEHVDLYRVTESLITWSETVDEQLDMNRMQQSVQRAANIVFLGFAFANQNLRLLKSDGSTPVRAKVYATGHGLTDDVDFKLKSKIARLYTKLYEDPDRHAAIKIQYGMKCATFMKQHLMNFTA